MPEYIKAVTGAEYEAAKSLFEEYAGWLNIDLCFQHFSEELEQISTIYAPPSGGIILVKTGETFIGCAGIRRIDGLVAELKRMYVKPQFQQQGIGKTLLQETLALATSLQYKKVRLDTLSRLEPAIKLYRQNGFYDIPAYYHNPEKSVVYLEKQLIQEV